jgi:DNA damage-inducible protein 1
MFTIEVAPDMALEDFKALCQIESGIESNQMTLGFNGNAMSDDKKPLKDYGITDGEVILLQKKNPSVSNPSSLPPGTMVPDFSGIQLPGSRNPPQGSPMAMDGNPAIMRDQILGNPQVLAQLRHLNPPLAAALEKGMDEFTKVLQEQRSAKQKADQMRIRMAVADPFDEEAQRMIAEDIERKNIDANMETAMEYHPESYGQVTMLYIECKVNGHPVKAFVDSGAQSTIMSNACAERCNIMRLIDKRWAGIAMGVGTQKIIGRVHLCQIQIEKDFFPTSFTILQDQPMDMLLGLDMLKRHLCSIDLRNNKLTFGSTGTETRFLNENEVPKKFTNEDDTHVATADDNALAQAVDQSLKEAAGNSGSQGASGFTPDPTAVQAIVSMGFKQEEVIQELTQSKGDQNAAIAALLAKSIQVPK